MKDHLRDKLEAVQAAAEAMDGANMLNARVLAQELGRATCAALEAICEELDGIEAGRADG